MKRRDFLKGAGVLIVGFQLDAQSNTQARDVSLNQVDSWIAIAQDESITIYSGKCDFGQGFSTVQPAGEGVAKAGARDRRADERKLHLAAVGVPGEREINSLDGSTPSNCRRVR